ncbi:MULTISPECIES: TfoX/Sxy family protein [unclassified Sphingomonas]|uniref:TfoX/Sxy family protein n=1 Tax=unclassified Sphingomonas TaxID=196159 RepID=UPI0006F53E40|nr:MULTISPECIES: TfoX/Sxy family protein [unclassified Sphingomonas]KQM61317.1 competence protein TfoX [Sphingomonas sp. Leaf16]KQN12412.1 competence protein TfoX [Sphingomonas sp. Leaf29]KQN18893.1 competence protein TfoX [Sphingomonas sp. Leaf32]
MSVDTGLIDWVEEAMAPVGQVRFRRMMGGATLYLDGTVFAIVLDDALWFKSDAVADARWDAAGCRRFTYDRKDGTTATMNYRRAPDEVLDDADALREWAMLAVEAGRRAPAKAAKKKRAGKSPPA